MIRFLHGVSIVLGSLSTLLFLLGVLLLAPLAFADTPDIFKDDCTKCAELHHYGRLHKRKQKSNES